jgi:hypothetical protein
MVGNDVQKTTRAGTNPPWWFGPSPLIAGEDRDAYAMFYDRVWVGTQRLSGKIDKGDIFMQIWMMDIADLTWDVCRYRRAKSDFISAALQELVRKMLHPSLGADAADLVRQWANRDADADEKIAEVLAEEHLSVETLTASVLVDRLPMIERMDRLIAGAEARRNAAFRELERHRANLARLLRDTSDDVIDAQCEDVPALAAKEKNS